ncbi:MAG TPA: hypothetical protein VKQ07_07280, partial [Jatrophihabitantaceae bacterium]|nr:hypothetical protein [Jatrophihabitantaceae bacterium]
MRIATARVHLFLGGSAVVLAVLTAIVVAEPSAQPTAHTARLTNLPPSSAASASTSTPRSVPATVQRTPPLAQPWAGASHDVGHVQPGSDPSVLPADLLIADKLNNRLVIVDPQGRVRWLFPRPGDLAAGQTFLVPDDAFFSPDGRFIIVTQEDDYVITVIDVATHSIAYRYGVPGQPGSGDNHLDNPDDALLLNDGYLLSADIKNCRIVLIQLGARRPARVIGMTTPSCRHAPPQHWGSPNGAFPMRNGHFLVTEINGDWVDEIGLDGHVYWSAHPPGVAYPSDSNEIGPDRYVTVDYSSPGQIVVFDHTGRTLWRFSGTGRNTLDH